MIDDDDDEVIMHSETFIPGEALGRVKFNIAQIH